MLASNVSISGIPYSGEYFKLTENISVTEMVGGGNGSSNVFKGTFDGDGHTITFNKENATEQYIAPFRRIKDAYIYGVKLEGSVSSSERFAGGIVAYATGTSTVINCVNSTSISITGTNTNTSNGGIVGMVGNDGNLTITGCVFNGQMSGTTTSNNTWSGILGLCNSGCTANISDCFIDPVSAVAYGNTIYRSSGTTNCSNCYYTKTIGNAQGVKVYSIIPAEPVTVQLLGIAGPDYNVSGITIYDDGDSGLKFNDVSYAASESILSLGLGVEPGYTASTYYANGTALTPGFYDNSYTLHMPAQNVVITADVTLTTVYREIEGYGEGTDRWAFIASPVVENITPDGATNHLIGAAIPETDPVVYDFDLYRLNPSDLMWENYHAHSSDFNIVNGMGYLYATKTTKTLAFSGTFNMGTSKDVTGLPQGFNLVGNPFIVDAYVSKPYYTLNSDGSAILTETSSNAILPCYGVIVEVSAEEYAAGNNKVTFSTEEQSVGPNNSGLSIALTQANTRNNALLDNAIVSFNEGSELGKFYFGTQDANIYIPQGNKDYAIAFSDKTGEMPLNFKAAKSGTYTLSVNPESVELAYLHLIDNLTGADVDLLATPNYTFNANMTDYESRFRLVFVAKAEDGASTGSETFAYYNGSEWMISNTGRATLQVVDAMGRVLRSETINGNATINTNGLSAGVYMLRLINSEDVRAQKIVVR